MRQNLTLEYAHQLEGVRRGIVTSEQLEALQALARSMKLDPRGRTPDLRWTVVLQSLIAAIVVAVPVIYGTEALREMSSLALATWSAAFAVTAFGVGEWLHRTVVYRVPGAILRASTGFFIGGIAMGAYASWRGLSLTSSMGADVSYELVRAQRTEVLAVGLLVAAIAGAVIGLVRRIPFAGAVVASALWGLAVTYGKLEALRLHQYYSDMQMSQVIIVVALGLFVAATIAERVWRRETDPAFWLHVVSLLSVGIVCIVRVDRRADEALPWLFVVLVMCGIGLRAGRRLHAVAGGAAIVLLPAYGMAEARTDGTMIVATFCASAIAAAVAMAQLRKHWTRIVSPRALESSERSVWA